MAELVFFDERRIELNKEIQNHPELCDILASQDDREFELLLVQVATYCDVVLDGDYMPQELDRLCGILTDKLRAKRAGIFI